MKIAIVCPHFPPDASGIGDYTARLAGQFARSGPCAVWTGRENPQAVDGVEVIRVPTPWDLTALNKITEALEAWKPDAVLIQYLAYLYNPLGIAPWLPLWIRSLRGKLQKPVALVAHELHYPIGLELKGLLIGVPQLAQFVALAAASDQVYFTYESALRRYARLMPWRARDFAWLPVGATIEPDPSHAEARPESSPTLLHFGGAHPTKLLGHSLCALRRIRALKGFENTQLVFVGIDSSALDPEPGITATGYLPPEEVSSWLRRADLVLAPFMDGVSTRRTSVMAALAHGRPLLTTVGYSSDRGIRWDDFCAVTDARDPEAFGLKAAQLIGDREALNTLARKAREAYQSRFSWTVLAKAIQERLAAR